MRESLSSSSRRFERWLKRELAWLATGLLGLFTAAPALMAPYVFTRTPALSHPRINMLNFWGYFLTGGIGAYLPKEVVRTEEQAQERA